MPNPTPEDVESIVRKHLQDPANAKAFRNKAKHLFVAAKLSYPEGDRLLDRVLQKMRHAGEIEYLKGHGWKMVAPLAAPGAVEAEGATVVPPPAEYLKTPNGAAGVVDPRRRGIAKARDYLKMPLWREHESQAVWKGITDESKVPYALILRALMEDADVHPSRGSRDKVYRDMIGLYCAGLAKTSREPGALSAEELEGAAVLAFLPEGQGRLWVERRRVERHAAAQEANEAIRKAVRAALEHECTILAHLSDAVACSPSAALGASLMSAIIHRRAADVGIELPCVGDLSDQEGAAYHATVASYVAEFGKPRG